MASRNLTYLGSPFEQGKGKATVVDTSSVVAPFFEGMKRLNEKRKADNEALKKEKEAQDKSAQDYQVDYHLAYQKEFQGRVNDVRQKGIDLRVKGYNLKDMTNPEVAQWYRDRINLEEDAKLSKGLGGLIDQMQKLTPEQLTKIKPQSIQDFKNFMDMPISEQLEKYRKGEAFTLQPYDKDYIQKWTKDLNDAWDKDIKNSLPSLQTQAELDKYKEERLGKVSALIDEIPDIAFSATTQEGIAQQKEELKDATIGMLNNYFENTAGRRKADADQTRANAAARSAANRGSTTNESDTESSVVKLIQNGDPAAFTDLEQHFVSYDNDGKNQRNARIYFSSTVAGKDTRWYRGRTNEDEYRDAIKQGRKIKLFIEIPNADHFPDRSRLQRFTRTTGKDKNGKPIKEDIWGYYMEIRGDGGDINKDKMNELRSLQDVFDRAMEKVLGKFPVREPNTLSTPNGGSSADRALRIFEDWGDNEE